MTASAVPTRYRHNSFNATFACVMACSSLFFSCTPFSSESSLTRDAGNDASSLTTITSADAGKRIEQVLTSDAGASEVNPLPPSSSEELTARAKHLLEAIQHDNSELATDFLLPRDAYVSARDSADPGKAWEMRVSSAYRKNLHAIHTHLKGIEKAQFVGFQLGPTIAEIAAKKKEWKRPMWRVQHSKLDVSIDGKPVHIEIADVVAWHGAWYIARLR